MPHAHAGLFGTAGSVLDFAAGLLVQEAAGEAHPHLLRRELRATRGHGWELPHPGWSGGDACSPETIGHTGFTGTGLWIDFAAGHAWTLLTNRIHPSRHTDSGIPIKISYDQNDLPAGGPELPIRTLFNTNVGVRGGVAPVRGYVDELLPEVLTGAIRPGRVFDLELPLSDVAQAYAAMDERRATKVLLRP